MAANGQAKSAEAVVRNIKRNTRRKFSAEDKIRIILEGIRADTSISELCRKEGIHPTQYCKWGKEFMEAGKQRLNGDTIREATSPEVQELRDDNYQLKQLLAEVIMENRAIKKSLKGLV